MKITKEGFYYEAFFFFELPPVLTFSNYKFIELVLILYIDSFEI